MPATTNARAAPAILGLARASPRKAAAFGLAFLLPAYLAFSNGGYDDVLRNEVGLAVWWIVLLGALVGVLPVARLDRRCWLGLGAVAAFVLWSALAITWSQSAQRSVNELARLAMYAGVLVLALASITRTGRRQALAGLAAGIGLVGLLALVSRLQPTWFTTRTSGLAALLALGVPATLAIAESARRLAWRALAAGSLPASAAALYLTGSTAGALALSVGLVAYLALAPERLAKLATLVNVAIGSGVLIASIAARPALDRGLASALAHQEGSQLLVIALLSCAGVALAQVAIALAVRHGEPPGWLVLSRRRTLQLLAGGLVAGAVVFVALQGPQSAQHEWQAFRAEPGRYQFWQAALAAAASHPWRGIGPGTFEFWWTAHGSFYGDVRHAYSLFFETLAELGFVGLALLLVALVLVLARAVRRALGADPERRLVLAGVVGGCAAFCFSAMFDWVWQLPGVVAAFLVLAAIGLGPAGAGRPRRAEIATDGAPRGQRLLLAGVAVVALAAIAIALLGASPPLQRALALEREGRFAPAAAAAAQATRAEPTNWGSWLVRSRLEAERGAPGPAIEAYRRARALNPRAPVFAR